MEPLFRRGVIRPSVEYAQEWPDRAILPWTLERDDKRIRIISRIYVRQRGLLLRCIGWGVAVVGEYFFVSYSRADATEVGPGLRDRFLADRPPYRLWVDVRDMVPGVDYDDQLEDAIQGCRALLLVMTPDSVRRGSGCRQELAAALKYKKPVIPLRYAPDAELPFRISSRQYIDFADGFDQGLARLRIFLDELDSPAGRLRELRFQLADAERQLERAPDDAQRARVEQDVRDLRARVAEVEGVAADPAAAATQAQERIDAGMQAVRSPARPEPERPARAKFINPPPATAPTYFQDRRAETGLLAGFLSEPDVRLVTVVGRGGVGKTAMVCRLLKGLEVGRLPDDLGEQPVDGIVYLKGSLGAHPVSFANLFADLCRLLPAETADRLGQRYLDPHETPIGLITALLEEFPADQDVVVLLDNFEDLLDEDAAITDQALDEGLRALMDAPAHGVTVVLTSRVAPTGLLLWQPGGQRRIDLEKGLPSPYAEEVLRARDPDGRLGLKNATDEVLGLLRERTRGFPRALEAVAAILAADRNTTLADLIALTERLPENVVRALVGDAFNLLDDLAQQVMHALAIYPVPVPPVAVDYLLQPYLPTINAGPVLARLVNMQFVRRDAGHYYLHQVDRDYALDQVPDGHPHDRDTQPAPFTEYALRDRAADYFSQTQTPREDWRTLDDLAPQLAEFELRVQGQDYDTAAQVLLGIDFDYLITWGHYRYVIKQHTRIHDHLTDPWTKGASSTSLGTCLYRLGQLDQAIELYEQALDVDREIGDRQGEAVDLGNLGNCYAGLGQTEKAIGLHEQALGIDREIGDRQGEAADLGNLGNCYADLGQTEKAIGLYEQALHITREIGYRQGEATHLGNLGNRYADLGQTEKAIGLYEQALHITREIGYRQGEATHLGNLGACYADLGQTEKGIQLHEQALGIDREIGDRQGEAMDLGNLGGCESDLGRWADAAAHLRDALAIGDETGNAQVQAEARRDLAWALLGAGDLPSAAQVADEAIGHSYPPAAAGSALVAGAVRLLQGERPAAHRAFQDALGHAQERLEATPGGYDALDTAALALAGLTLTGPTDRTQDAVTAFHAARAITGAAGITARTLRKLAALTSADPAGKLHALQVAVGPYTSDIDPTPAD